MFTPSQLEQMPIELERRLLELQQHTMEDIIRRIKINDEITRSADWQIYRMVQMGQNKEYIQKQIQAALELIDIEINSLYERVIEAGYSRDEKIYKAVGKEFIPFKDNAELQQLIGSVIQQTKSQMFNITQTLGFAIEMNGKMVFTPMSEYMQKTLDTAVLEVTSGIFDYNTTLKKVVSEMTKSGLRTVDYATGWNNRIEVAARRALMTGITQVTEHINVRNADELGTDKFEISWHSGARPSHAEWQGRVYTKKQLVDICGLGTGSGLMGWNCYHSYYPFIEGISERQYTDEQLDEMNTNENKPREFNGRKFNAYEATQKQRQLETLMRAQRQKIKLLDKGGADPNDLQAAQIKYRETMRQYKIFSQEMKLPQQKERVYMDGLGRIGGGKGIAKPSQSSIIRDDKQFGKKIGKHAKDYGLDPANPADRSKMSRIIDDIISNNDEVVKGSWRGQDGVADFYIKGSDVVVVNKGKFVTILKGGVENARVKNARER